MANYIPKGWRCSAEGQQRFRDYQDRINALIARRVLKYSIPSMEREDLVQEGRLAALYAIDTFQEGRGKLDNYIGVVVENALAMVCGESLAKCRQAYTHEWDGDSWQKIPAKPSETDPDDTPTSDGRGEQRMLDCEDKFARMERVERERMRFRAMSRLNLSPDGRVLLDLYKQTPPELSVLTRNLIGRERPAGSAFAVWLKWPRSRVDRAIREVKQVLARRAA